MSKIPIRVVGRKFGFVGGDQYHRGETFEGSEELLEKHPNTLERVEQSEQAEEEPEPAEGDEQGPEDDAEDVEDEDPPEEADSASEDDEGSAVEEDELDPHPSDLTNDEIAGRVQDVDDTDLLDALLEAEQAGKNRKGATAAIEARIGELEA